MCLRELWRSIHLQARILWGDKEKFFYNKTKLVLLTLSWVLAGQTCNRGLKLHLTYTERKNLYWFAEEVQRICGIPDRSS